MKRVRQWVERQHRRWMAMEPASQFLAWSAGSAVLFGLTAAAFVIIISQWQGLSVPALMTLVGAGVIMMTGILMSAVLYLAIWWPHHRAQRQQSAGR